MNFLNLTDKTFVVFGVANRKSVAWHVARSLEEQGARVVYSVQSEERRKARCYQYTLTAVQLCIDTLIRFERAPSPATLLK